MCDAPSRYRFWGRFSGSPAQLMSTGGESFGDVCVGLGVGTGVVSGLGAPDGSDDGAADGLWLGEVVCCGFCDDGATVGCMDGNTVGAADGRDDGVADGLGLGSMVGGADGFREMSVVVGAGVGASW